MDAPFTHEKVAAEALFTPLRKSVQGPLAPWLLRAAAGALVQLLTTVFEDWRRVGCLSSCDARSRITSIPKPGATPGLCGIAVGTQAAKLYAVLPERRLSAWAKGPGQRAAGQFGFRHNRSTSGSAGVAHAAG